MSQCTHSQNIFVYFAEEVISLIAYLHLPTFILQETCNRAYLDETGPPTPGWKWKQGLASRFKVNSDEWVWHMAILHDISNNNKVVQYSVWVERESKTIQITWKWKLYQIIEMKSDFGS